MHYNGCDYLSMLGLKLNHVSKRGHWSAPSQYLNRWWLKSGRPSGLSRNLMDNCLPRGIRIQFLSETLICMKFKLSKWFLSSFCFQKQYEKALEDCETGNGNGIWLYDDDDDDTLSTHNCGWPGKNGLILSVSCMNFFCLIHDEL